MTRYFEIIENKFIDNVIKGGFNANREDIIAVLNNMKPIIDSGNDPDQIVEQLLEKVNNKVLELMQTYPIPGYNIAINSGNISVITYGGVLDSTGRPMIRDAIFDPASFTKLITETISHSLIRENFYSFDSKVSDLHPKFKNLGDLTIGEIMGFIFEFTLEEGKEIEDANSVEEAKDNLYSISLKRKGIYRYTDHGMMILKEVMEYVTGMSFEQLVEKYITKKLGLKNTFLRVPEEKRDRLTGTPNAHLGLNNDMKAIKMGGFSGNSGLQSISEELLQIVKNLYTNDDFFPNEHLFRVYTESEPSKIADFQRGIMGNACTVGGSFVSGLSPIDASAYQGSTRTQVNVGTYNGILTTSAVLLNPASMGLKRAREEEKKLNKENKFVKEYTFEGQDYVQISAQSMLSTKKVVAPLTDLMAELSLSLAFLNAFMHEDNLNRKVNVEMENGIIKKQIIKAL